MPPSLWRALLPHASTGDPPALAGGFGSVSYGGHCSFPLGVDVPRILFVPSKTGVSFPQSCGSPIIQSCWPSWPDFLGIPSPFVRSPDWETQRIPNLHNRGRTSLVFSFSSLWVSHVMGMGFDLIVIMSLLPSSLQLLCPWTRDLFFWWVPASCWWLFNSLVAALVFSLGEMSAGPPPPPSQTGSPEPVPGSYLLFLFSRRVFQFSFLFFLTVHLHEILILLLEVCTLWPLPPCCSPSACSLCKPPVCSLRLRAQGVFPLLIPHLSELIWYLSFVKNINMCISSFLRSSPI